MSLYYQEGGQIFQDTKRIEKNPVVSVFVLQKRTNNYILIKISGKTE